MYRKYNSRLVTGDQTASEAVAVAVAAAVVA